LLGLLEALFLLAARWYVAGVFFSAGLTKLRDWDTTILLFENEYSVPLLPPLWAAWGGTLGELLLPPLLLLGLLDRLPALGLLVVNVVAVLSLQEVAPAVAAPTLGRASAHLVRARSGGWAWIGSGAVRGSPGAPWPEG
jgi:putative oxidoreductase